MSKRTKITISNADLAKEADAPDYVQCLSMFAHSSTGTVVFCRRDRNKPHGEAHRGAGVQWSDDAAAKVSL